MPYADIQRKLNSASGLPFSYLAGRFSNKEPPLGVIDFL